MPEGSEQFRGKLDQIPNLAHAYLTAEIELQFLKSNLIVCVRIVWIDASNLQPSALRVISS